jgi:hypothetical protein
MKSGRWTHACDSTKLRQDDRLLGRKALSVAIPSTVLAAAAAPVGAF